MSTRLLDEMRDLMRRRCCSIHTERAYRDRVKRYIRSHNMRSMDDPEIPTNSRVLGLVDDEELEALQRVEQLRESDFKPMIASQPPTEKHRRQNGPAP